VILWIDAQLSPSLARWIADEFNIEAAALRAVGLRDAGDKDISLAARKADAVVMTKDSDFLHLLDHLGPPPQIIWISCGNTSNAAMRTILGRELGRALDLLSKGERMVEIRR
jgi:predicted nuclease of predicted toxin-antitoxin system